MTRHANGALDVVTIGEAMAMFVAQQSGDLAAVENFVKRVAGAELNVAIGLARLGLKVGWVSRTGDDSFGSFVRQQLEKERVDQGCVTTDRQHRTGFQLKGRVDDGSDPQVEYFRQDSAASHLSPADLDRDYFASARHLHLSGVAAALSDGSFALLQQAAGYMKAAGKTLSFDPNLRPVLWPDRQQMVRQLNQLACSADWVLPGINEGVILTGHRQPEAIADFYLERGVQAVMIKTGADGAWYKTAQGDKGQVAAIKPEKVVDTVGAGDGFAVGVISALLEGKRIEEAVRRGNRIGSLAIQVSGDSEGLPNRRELGDY
ncbi:2-dehydro-3-deoxygluconokinase [Izhakiella australiensis]|uniref:2-dehydro-3-deoxygluconokinase n=1 Tax=Izhakiella australiensis TaxID=1926881 RepID=A0A1S8YN92_9GAMM|nr:sugar kinase [Izhakiella australiensis]OON40206.1 2-dehydro-3-deoxygluconokinase [Izhakiella australiensis]